MSFAAVVERLQKLENPYPGLRPFDTSESHLFFGRDQQVAELVRRLEQYRFLAVLGASGSGKSSLVRAGLIPALERGGVWEAGRRWRRLVTQPAGAPFESLGADLAKAGLDGSHLKASSHGLIQVARQLRDDESLLVVVDQFEELFRYKDVQPITEDARRTRDRQAAEAAEFVQVLLEASRHYPPIYIVITMRSDYLGDCAEFRDLPEMLNDCQYLVPRMTRQQRQAAIEGPLGRVAIAPSLVQRMLNDAGDEPDQLPVLQHALMRTWSQWRTSDPNQTRRIELQDYDAIGGFDGALNRHADELLEGVPQEIAACLFKRLTARGRSNRERRDPATLSELWAVCGADTPARQQQVSDVIDRFRSGEATFLRPLAGSIKPDMYVDITHESLIRLWKRLRDEWLPQEEQSAKMLVDLVERARTRKAGKGELLGGLDFVRFDDWERQRNKSAAWAQHYIDEATLNDAFEFLNASRAQERRRRLVSRTLWSAVVLLVVGGLVFIAYLAIERRRVAEQQRLAQAEAEAASAEAAASRAEALSAANNEELRSLQTQLVVQRTTADVPPAPSTVTPDVTPRLYIQVRSKAVADDLRGLVGLLRKAGITVPPTQILDTGPSANELRYFRNEERSKADEILRIVQQADVVATRLSYVAGFEDSTKIRRNHFELWLAPADMLTTLVQQLDDGSEDVRKRAGGRLARDYRSDPDAITRVLQTLSEPNLRSLSANGRINGLYFLNRSDPTAWTDAHKMLARDAIVRLRAAGAGSGAQTSHELKALEQKVAY